MTEAAVLDILRQSLWTALIVSTPILGVALGGGYRGIDNNGGLLDGRAWAAGLSWSAGRASVGASMSMPGQTCVAEPATASTVRRVSRST